MDPIKEAFSRIKQDITNLIQEINTLKQEISSLKDQTMPTNIPTQTPLNSDNPTHNQTIQHSVQPPKPQNMPISTGNQGVPTDKQTNRQTNQQTDNEQENQQKNTENQGFNDFERAKEILDSLDSIKKEIRLKFKRLTAQEMLVFSALYTLVEQNIEEITYKIIANNLNLSESSIRDYINKLIKKGIPILKIRQNNKKIALQISPDLQKVANLSTIMQLREL